MESIQIFLRVKNSDELKEISLSPLPYTLNTYNKKPDLLWESAGDYFLEAYQCGSNPYICSIEKDPRILNEKEEIALIIQEEIDKAKRIRW